MLRHVVMFRWTEDTTADHVRVIQERLGGLPAAIPAIRRYELGPDAGLNEGNYDFVVVADFADPEDYVAYRDHPLHQAVIADHIRDHVAARAAVQYHVA